MAQVYDKKYTSADRATQNSSELIPTSTPSSSLSSLECLTQSPSIVGCINNNHEGSSSSSSSNPPSPRPQSPQGLKLRKRDTRNATNGTHTILSIRKEDAIAAQNNSSNDREKVGSPLLLLLCATGICTCYLSYGLVQERLFSKDSSSGAVRAVGSITTFMLVLQCLTNVLVSTLWIRSQSIIFFLTGREGILNRNVSSQVHKQQIHMERLSLNHKLLIMTSFFYFAAMTASNESLTYVTYPTAVLAKSSKMIPTMVVGFFVEHRSYSFKEWAGAALITGGIVSFNFSRIGETSDHSSDKNQNNSAYGLTLLLFSLVMDGLLASCQGLVKKSAATATATTDSKPESLNKDILHHYRPPTALETMLWTNAYALLFLLPMSIWSGQFTNGMKLIQPGIAFDEKYDDEDSSSLPWIIGLLNLTAAAGQVFIFFTIQYFSPLMCTTITTTRKFFTILLSVLKFGHVFTSVQWGAIFMVFGGLYLQIASKTIGQKKKSPFHEKSS